MCQWPVGWLLVVGQLVTVWHCLISSLSLFWEPFTVSHFWKWHLSFMGTKGCRTRQIARRGVLSLLPMTGYLDTLETECWITEALGWKQLPAEKTFLLQQELCWQLTSWPLRATWFLFFVQVGGPNFPRILKLFYWNSFCLL